MTATTTAAEFADQLRALANLYDASPELPVHDYPLRITDKRGTPEAYLALRRLFPDAPVDATDDSFVRVEVDVAGLRLAFSFWKFDIGVKQLVTREVTEYVLPDVAVAS